MSFNLKVEGIIGSVIFTERNIIDWNEYKINILHLLLFKMSDFSLYNFCIFLLYFF